MNTELFVNATIGFSKNLLLVLFIISFINFVMFKVDNKVNLINNPMLRQMFLWESLKSYCYIYFLFNSEGICH